MLQILADWVALLLQPSSFERHSFDLQGTVPDQITQQLWQYSDHGGDLENLGRASRDLNAADPGVVNSLLLSLVTEMVRPTNWSISAACDVIAAVSSSTSSSSSSAIALCMRDAVDAVQTASLKLMNSADADTTTSNSRKSGSHNNRSSKAAKVKQQPVYNEHQQQNLAMGLSWSCLVSVLQLFAITAYKPSAAWGAAATNLALAYFLPAWQQQCSSSSTNDAAAAVCSRCSA